MDIKEAAEAMQHGKRVRRPWLSAYVSIGIIHSEMFPDWIMVFDSGERARDGRTAAFDIHDLLADDWEIAE